MHCVGLALNCFTCNGTLNSYSESEIHHPGLCDYNEKGVSKMCPSDSNGCRKVECSRGNDVGSK